MKQLIIFASALILCAFPAAAQSDAAIVAAPDWTSLLPALVAIVLAFLTRQVFISLFLGTWIGAWLMLGISKETFLPSILDVLDTYIMRALVPEDGSTEHMAIVLFTLTVGGMIGIISRNGGMGGIVNALSRFAHSPKRAQGSAYGMGFLIFFDDYANTLIVGKTMQPLLDKMRVSREKLAFIVDSTSAPLAAIALVTTWIGFQVSLMEDSIATIPDLTGSAYEIFLGSLGYSFYPVMMLAFIFFIIVMGRDFGPMLTAERAARDGKVTKGKIFDGDLHDDVPHSSAWNALLPILVLIVSTIAGLYITGEGDTLRSILGSADPFTAMLWSSLLSLLTAMLVSAFSRTLTLDQTMGAMEEGFKPMLLAVMILTFAWAIANINADLRTADYITSLLGEATRPEWIPVAVFIIAALTAFATGTSFGTMGILVPLVLPLTWNMLDAPLAQMYILEAAVASVMAGAVWGDHCSPISDTTVLSSLASNCHHIEHVRTQLPYAVVVALVAIVTGIIPAGFGMHWGISMLTGIAGLWFILRVFGKQTESK